MKEVYIVQVGSYSDKYIARVCETREAAEKYVSIMQKYRLNDDVACGDVSIEMYPVNDAVFDKTPHYVRVSFSDTLCIHIWDELYDKPFETKKNEGWSTETTPYRSGVLWLDMCFDADELIHMKDPKVVRKICCDRMAEWKAKQASIM